MYICMYVQSFENNTEGYEIFTAVIMKVAIFWDIAPCGPYVNGLFSGAYDFHLQWTKISRNVVSLTDYTALLSRKIVTFKTHNARSYKQTIYCAVCRSVTDTKKEKLREP
jgi:hypothetical protein